MAKRKDTPDVTEQPERVALSNALSGSNSYIEGNIPPELSGVLANALSIVVSCGGSVTIWYDNSLGIYSCSVRLGTTQARKRGTSGEQFVLELWHLAEKFREYYEKLFPGAEWPGPTVEWLQGVENPLEKP